MAGGRTYLRPPVTEAVIELRYENPVSQSNLEKAAARLEKEYSISENELAQNVTLDAQAGNAAFSTAWQGLKRSSSDRTEVVIFRTVALVIGHLAPHKGWEHLLEKTKNAWFALARATGENLALSRAGVRYINRIDIPHENKQPVIFDYIQFRPQAPEGLIRDSSISEYYAQVAYSIAETELGARIIVANGVSPLIGHSSIVFDVDVFRDHLIPRRVEDLWHLLSELRDQKNIIFEDCITDKARELFDR